VIWPFGAIVSVSIPIYYGVKAYSIPKKERLISFKLSYTNAHVIGYTDLISDPCPVRNSGHLLEGALVLTNAASHTMFVIHIYAWCSMSPSM
jgi:hypothetical protein